MFRSPSILEPINCESPACPTETASDNNAFSKFVFRSPPLTALCIRAEPVELTKVFVIFSVNAVLFGFNFKAVLPSLNSPAVTILKVVFTPFIALAHLIDMSNSHHKKCRFNLLASASSPYHHIALSLTLADISSSIP